MPPPPRRAHVVGYSPSRSGWRERHPWGWLAVGVAAAWLVLAAVFLGAFEGLLFADCARVRCAAGPDPDLQRFARLTALVLATMLTVPIAAEWAVRLRGERRTSQRLGDEIAGFDRTGARAATAGAFFPTRQAGAHSSSFGEAVSRAALRIPSSWLALAILVLDLLALFALVSLSSALYSYNTLLGYPIIIGWLLLTMVVPVLTLQYVVFGSGPLGASRDGR